jgi:peptidoglycan hydrolase-like protein with peptidoglycan-binding domain
MIKLRKAMKRRIFLTIIVFSFLVIFRPAGALAITPGSFFVDPGYDATARSEVPALLVKTTPKIYFYIEKSWWDGQVISRQNEILSNLDNISKEFENRIYPILTSVFGSEWNPGIDGDSRIVIFFHQMKEDAGGYFRSADEYLKIQYPESNEKEMIYMNINQISSPQLNFLISHEFVHLITFNQKDRIYGVSEEVWLNEARAEYSATILGYNDVYEGSNLQRRVKAFLERPTDSLTEWLNKKYDYGSVDLFTSYLIDHYGIGILSDSLKLKLVGIPSINEAMKKNGFEDDFSQVFTNWTIALLINDCSLNNKYCYLNNNLKSLKLSPALNFLPLTSKSSLSVADVTKNWSPNWQKFVGGNGSLKLDFEATAGLNFKIPYLLFDASGNYSISSIALSQSQKGSIGVEKFGEDIKSLVIIPSLQSKISGFGGVEPTYSFSFTVSVSENTSVDEQKLIEELLVKIEFLKKEIEKVKAQLAAQNQKNSISCNKILNNLSIGSQGPEVSCLQEFLKFQGVSIYSEGKITGYFGSLTKVAVINFQEKYRSEILLPGGFQSGTGIVGPLTRQKINQILGT